MVLVRELQQRRAHEWAVRQVERRLCLAYRRFARDRQRVRLVAKIAVLQPAEWRSMDDLHGSPVRARSKEVRSTSCRCVTASMA